MELYKVFDNNFLKDLERSSTSILVYKLLTSKVRIKSFATNKDIFILSNKCCDFFNARGTVNIVTLRK